MEVTIEGPASWLMVTSMRINNGTTLLGEPRACTRRPNDEDLGSYAFDPGDSGIDLGLARQQVRYFVEICCVMRGFQEFLR